MNIMARGVNPAAAETRRRIAAARGYGLRWAEVIYAGLDALARRANRARRGRPKA